MIALCGISKTEFISSIRRAAGVLAISAYLAASGCVTVGPDYVRPEVPVPAQWNIEPDFREAAGRLDARRLADWWSTFNDPVLSSLIQRATQGNLDARAATARVRESRARRGVSRAERFPSVNTTGSASSTRSSEATGRGDVSELYSAGFDAAWELDLFGGKQRGVEAAQADLEASEEELRGVLVTLIGETALNYVDVRSYQTRLSIAEANRDAQQETYQITQWRFEAGLTTKLDVEQAQYNLEQTRSQIPALWTSLEKAKNQLAVLLGKPPGELPGELKDELSTRRSVPVAPLELAIGIPADVLRNRPDVRQNERKLAAQTARIGVAVAELYPKFTLSGSIGLEALSTKNFFSSGNQTHVISLPFTWNIFDAGRIRRNIEVQNALQEQALAQYEASILSALEEVENALIAYAHEQVRQQALLESSQAAQRTVDLAQSRYASGLIDFQVVLDAQRSLLSAQDQLAVSDAEATSDLIRLYKSLGGGWPASATAKSKPTMIQETKEQGEKP